jgi:hypothetical protein
VGNQIVRQPDGNYAVFSTGTDTIIVYNATAEEIVEWFVDRAAEDARRQVRNLIEHVAAGNARAAYFQFALSWDEVLDMDREHGGEAWREFDTLTESQGEKGRISGMSEDQPLDKTTLSIMMTQEAVEDAGFDVSRHEMLKMIQEVDASLADRGRRRVRPGTFRITFEVETENAGEGDV